MASSVSYDETLRKWVLSLPDRSQHLAGTIIIDTPCDGRTSSLTFTESQMTFSQNGERVVIGRDTPLPEGYVNDPVMKDWECRWDPVKSEWVVFDSAGNITTTKWLTLDCHAESRGPVLHCRAECLVNGATFKGGAHADADTIHLRTLVVYNQSVQMNVMAISKSQLVGMGG